MHPISGSNPATNPARGLRIRIAIATLCLPVHACDLGNGGAVELSWSLRPASSAEPRKFVGCDDQDSLGNPIRSIKQIRLHWQVGSMPPCSHAWPCDANHGATGFEIAQGVADLWLTLECGDPNPGDLACAEDDPAVPDTYIAPATVQREVIRGQAVTLGAVEVVVSSAACPGPPCTCPIGGTTAPQVATDHTSR
jgi:hypothetical protein